MKNKFLKTDVIYKIGCVIRHDFSREFPELFTPEDFIPTNKSNRVTRRTNFEASDAMDNQWKDKYLDLLENYNQALLKKLSQSTANSLKENAAN